ncbi:MAG: hypothetical protein J6Q85_00805 [Clostridia bacterium]|nr:hypothetical protein [Clostridia bacterium]
MNSLGGAPVKIGAKEKINFVIPFGEKVKFEYAKAKAFFEQLSALGLDLTLTDASCKGAPEIIVGYDKSSPVSERAYALLREMKRSLYYDMRYVVYADDRCVAIAYDYNDFTEISVLDFIKEPFIKAAVTSDGSISCEGVVLSGKVDLLEEQTKIDAAERVEQWAALKQSLVERWGEDKAEELYEAFKTLYTLCDDGLVVWAANLYDAGVGGYYVTASARDHIGFAPSPEMTYMHMLTARTFGAPGEAEMLMPDLMKYQIVYFCKSVQDEDGYFYPPAARKSDLRTKGKACRARNLGTTVELLELYGAKPVYDNPICNGDGITADEYWADLRARGLVDRDPPRVPLNLDDLENIQSEEGAEAPKSAPKPKGQTDMTNYKMFIDWLEKQNLDKSPYGAGNNIQARCMEINSSSAKMEPPTYTPESEEATNEKYSKYAGLTMREITIKYFNDHVNSETGLWGDPEIAKPGEGATGTEFLFTNGYFKISLAYNTLGAPLPYPEKAIESIMKGIVSEEPTVTNACDVYNVWTCINLLRNNLRDQYNDGEMVKVRERILKRIDEVIAEYGAKPIITAYKKQSRYKLPDGSFSHNTLSGYPWHQGPHHISLGIEREGDIDAIGKCIGGTIGPIRTVYGAKPIPYFQRHHFMNYMQIIVSNGPVLKYDREAVERGEVEFKPNTRLKAEPLVSLK